MSVVDLAGEGVARDDELCDALAGRVYDGLPNDGVSAALAQWCADVDRGHPAIVLPTAELAAALARRHTRRRTARVVGVAAAVVVICLGGLSLARPQASTAPSGRQELSTSHSESSHAHARVVQSLRMAQHDLAAHRWIDAESALLQAQIQLPAVAASDGRAALSEQLRVIRQQLGRMIADGAPPRRATSGHRPRTATRHVRARSQPLLASSGGNASTDQTDQSAGAANPPTSRSAVRPAQAGSAPGQAAQPTRRREPPRHRSASLRSSRPRPARPHPKRPRFGPHPIPPVGHAPIVWPPHPISRPSERPPTGIKLPGWLPQDSDRVAGAHRWHVRAERHTGGWHRFAGHHATVGGHHRR